MDLPDAPAYSESTGVKILYELRPSPSTTRREPPRFDTSAGVGGGLVLWLSPCLPLRQSMLLRRTSSMGGRSVVSAAQFSHFSGFLTLFSIHRGKSRSAQLGTVEVLLCFSRRSSRLHSLC